jgi:hypothetical protein
MIHKKDKIIIIDLINKSAEEIINKIKLNEMIINIFIFKLK